MGVRKVVKTLLKINFLEVCGLRKVLFNIFLVVEVIFNIKLLMVVYLATSVFAVFCSYDSSIAEGYGSYLLTADKLLTSVTVIFIIVSLIATSLKMLINETGTGLGIGFLKSVVPFLAGVALIVLSSKVETMLVSKFGASTEYQELVFSHLTLFWVLLLIVIVKSVVNSNAGFTEVTQLTGSNEVALKYFDGILSDVDFEQCDILALKYGGEESNE